MYQVGIAPPSGLNVLASPAPGRDRVLAIRGYRSRGRVVIADENTPLGWWHVLAARGDARPPQCLAPIRYQELMA